MKVTVIELNPHLGDDSNARVVHGDAGKMQILRQANINSASSVTITIPDPSRAQGLVRRIRAVAPRAKIVVRGRYFRSLDDLRTCGAHIVVDEETQTGQHLADATVHAVTVFEDV
jgi:voltage-gated potassium channel Kch